MIETIILLLAVALCGLIVGKLYKIIEKSYLNDFYKSSILKTTKDEKPLLKERNSFNILFILFIITIISVPTIFYLATSVSYEPSKVEVKGNNLLVDGERFTVKGVTYSPIYAGEDPRKEEYNDWLKQKSVYESDFAMMKAMGINTIRLINMTPNSPEVFDLLDEAEKYDIKVIMGYPGPIKEDAGDPAVREKSKRDARAMVESYKDHPAILMWMMGNEVNHWYPQGKDIRDWYTLLEEISNETKQIDPNHPIMTANSALSGIWDFSVTVKSVDIYGMNDYSLSEWSWDWVFSDYRNKSSVKRPMLVTEFGSDSWNSNTGTEDQESQARLVVESWKAIDKQEDSLGGLVFEWSDEWWKSEAPRVQNCDKDWQPWNKQFLPDGWFSEECFGIVKIDRNENYREPKLVYYKLKEAWSDPEENISPTIAYARIDVDGNVETSITAYAGAETNATLYYKPLFSDWKKIEMEKLDWRYVGKIPSTAGPLQYKIIATDEFGRRSELNGMDIVFNINGY